MYKQGYGKTTAVVFRERENVECMRIVYLFSKAFRTLLASPTHECNCSHDDEYGQEEPFDD